MKKSVFLAIALVMISNVPAHADNLSNTADGVFERRVDCAHDRSEGMFGPGDHHMCGENMILQLVAVLAESRAAYLSVNAIVHNNISRENDLLESYRVQQRQVEEAQAAYFREQNAMLSIQREARAYFLRAEITRLNEAFERGYSMTISPRHLDSLSARLTRMRINELEQINRSLEGNMREAAYRAYHYGDRAEAEALGARRAENNLLIAQLRAGTARQLSEHATLTAAGLEVGHADLPRAIVALQHILTETIEAPELSLAQRDRNVAAALQNLLRVRQNIGRRTATLFAARAVRVVSIIGTGFLILDMTGRAVAIVTSHDPGLTPLPAMTGAAVRAFRHQ